MNLLADASLPGLEAAFSRHFKLTKYTNQKDVPNMLEGKDILLCRSTLKVDAHLIKDHPLRFVATASSGVDHLDAPFLHSKNIQVIDAKGCNAISVADYVESCLAFLDISEQLQGKKAAIIGLGKVGTKVLQRLQLLGYQVKCYDPPKAELEADFKTCSLQEIIDSDLLCIHAELQKNGEHPSFDLINTTILKFLKPHTIIINAARGGIVNEQDILDSTIPLIYCTDVYLNEPHINKAIVDKARLCTPHIAGHSLEAKYNAITLVSHKLHASLGLPLPQCETPSKPKPVNRNLDWQDRVLSIYNPIEETNQLKSSNDVRVAFINLRKAHNIRHDFSTYLQGNPSPALDNGEV